MKELKMFFKAIMAFMLLAVLSLTIIVFLTEGANGWAKWRFAMRDQYCNTPFLVILYAVYNFSVPIIIAVVTIVGSLLALVLPFFGIYLVLSGRSIVDYFAQPIYSFLSTVLDRIWTCGENTNDVAS